MKTILLLITLSGATAAVACKEGFVPTDTPGVCVEKPVDATNPAWIVDEKPPSDKMPSYQREGVVVIDVPNTAEADRKMDREKAEADAQGKQSAGIAPGRKP